MNFLNYGELHASKTRKRKSIFRVSKSHRELSHREFERKKYEKHERKIQGIFYSGTQKV